MEKMIAARTRMRGFCGHFTGLNLGLFWRTGDLYGFIFEQGKRAVF
jgi:hypothetical protein